MTRLLLFAKRPLLGRVKTRLVPPLSKAQAWGLYRAFLFDQVAFLRSFAKRCQVELCLDGPWSPQGQDDPGLAGLSVTQQGPGDLGERLSGAFERSRASGSSATAIIGADSPTLPAGLVLEALRCLESGAPAVVSPAVDGGYVLIGLRRPCAELFRDVAWGGDTVLQTTRERAAGCGLRLRELHPWYDVDDLEGLRRVHAELEGRRERSRAPATARFLDHLDLTRLRVL